MTTDNVLPLSIREVKPAKYATRITGQRYDGLPDGVHTGGAYLWEGEVYKPLDGRPYANADCHLPTQEAECLEAMADQPCFPRNWRVETRDGRRFLVRKEAYVIDNPHELEVTDLLLVEKAVRELNKAGWQVGDALSLARDFSTYELFILDLSCAHKLTGAWMYDNDENWRVVKLFKQAGFERLAAMRERGQHVFHDPLHFKALFDRDVRDFHFLYGSFNRPLSKIWATLPADVLLIDSHRWYTEIDNLMRQHTDGVPHTWIASPGPLDDDLLYRYELTFCWEEI